MGSRCYWQSRRPLPCAVPEPALRRSTRSLLLHIVCVLQRVALSWRRPRRLALARRVTLPAVVCAGRAGVPLEVMGLMLGEFVDDYTVQCVDVFAMPQSGTSVSVESVDYVFQQQMLDMLKQTGRCVVLSPQRRAPWLCT